MAKSDDTSGKPEKKDSVKLRLEVSFVDDLDAMAKRLSISRNGVINLLVREGMKYSSLVINEPRTHLLQKSNAARNERGGNASE